MISDVLIRKLLPDAVPTTLLSAQPQPSTSKTANKSHASDVSTQTKDSSVVKLKNVSFTDVHTQTARPFKHQEAQTSEALSSGTPRKRKLRTTLQDSETKRKRLEYSPFVNRCDDCQTFFVSENNVKADRSNIQDRYRCSECQVGFKTKRRLHRHINSVHSYETIYSCDYCRKKFTNKEYILIHMKIKHARGSFKCDESEPNIYVCDYCGKTFTYKSNIIPHLYKHTANTKCAICDASVKPARMKRHVRRMHGNEEVQCEHCGETVKSECGFQQHVNGHHGRIHDQRDQQSTGTCGEHNQQSTCSKVGEESGEGTLPPEVNAGASASSEHQYEVFIKEESADQELDLGPVVFQHIDSNYRPYKEEPLLD